MAINKDGRKFHLKGFYCTQFQINCTVEYSVDIMTCSIGDIDW